MAIKYCGDYGDMCLNEVVIVGSHDAGVTKGGWNTKTQEDGIQGQATNGARFFDIRVAAFANKRAGGVELRTYHDATKKEVKVAYGIRHVNAVGRVADNVVEHKTRLGAKTDSLSAMMNEAVAYLDSADGQGEFLIFKFNKSTNPGLIAEVCATILRRKLFTCSPGEGDLNRMKLSDLAGKVILLFDNDMWKTCGIPPDERSQQGILQWKSLFSRSSRSATGYDHNFDGLQYYGKGGTSATAWTNPGKISLNAKKQGALMRGEGSYKLGSGERGHHAGVDPRAMGVMYWTTTGLSVAGISRRNDDMWGKSGVKKLSKAAGLPKNHLLGAMRGEAITAAPSNLNPNSASAAPRYRQFIPNIVMVDFVSEANSRIVIGMNSANGLELMAADVQGI